MQISWDEAKISLTPKQVSQLLKESKPSIIMAAGEEKPGLSMNSFMLQAGEDKVVAEQLARILREHTA